MKKFFAIALALVILSGLFGGCGNAGGKITINVFNWGEYISDGTDGSLDVNKEFEKETGIHVNYTTFQNNEELLTKLSSGGVSYDVIIPSDYMIGKLIELGMLEKLDFTNIPNKSGIGQEFNYPEYDPTGEYSIPYAWGTVGIVYNTKYVKKTVDSWNILWDEDYKDKILMFDNPRDAFSIAMFRNGFNTNTTDESQWRKCAEDLKQQKPLLQAYVMDQIYDKMEIEEAWIAPYYAGDAITMHESNENLAFAFPKEGVNYFVDAMCIPKGSKNKKAAEQYINYLCNPEISAANCDFTAYSTPIPAAKALCDPLFTESPIAYPPEDVLKNTQRFLPLPQVVDTLQKNLWVEIKATN